MKKLFKCFIQVVCCLAPILSVSKVHGNWFDFELFDKEDIFEAIESEKAGNIERLLEKGVDIEVRKEEGYTPLLFSVHKTVSEDIILTLLDHGAHLEACDAKGNKPLLLACKPGEAYYRKSRDF